ncbi:hypothetical protein EDF35_1249 [Rathayibacter sp. PhB151]|nr:hypothetical protein [Rathayibacter sp. PhB151]TDX81579.1 hypothetical protein EDF35_1249 [Rathayibacter sp. PhB151]
MSTTTTPAVDVDVWGHNPALRDAQAAVDATASATRPRLPRPHAR